MSLTRGKLIVLEGLDGSGKATQAELLKNSLKKMSKKVCSVSFPDYKEPSSTLISMYLNGSFGSDPNAINPYAVSSFYAVDRYASFTRFWQEKYNSGYIIIADRYTTSNAIYQMVKLDKDEWCNYLNWLEDYEYKKLAIPKPDLVIYLDVPIEVSQKLLLERYKNQSFKMDIHEKNIKFLKYCREAALYSAEKLRWKTVDCTLGGENISDVNKIQDYILKLI